MQGEHKSGTQVDRHHKPELDGVRGIAILCVLLSHSMFVLGLVPVGVPGVKWGGQLATIFVPGWAGVDLFFALSGFLITGILLRARKRTTYFSSFYMRRVLRIFPIYYLYLATTLILSHLSWRMAVIAFVPVGFRHIAPFLLYLQNWPVFWPNWTGIPTLWALYWSLAVEEQFYLVWPTVLRFIRLRAVLAFCIIGFLLGWFERFYMVHRFGVSFGIMQWPFSRLDGLFLGAALAIYRELHGRPVPLRWATWGFFAGLGMFAWIAIFHRPELRSGNGLHVWTTGVTAFALMSGGLIAATQYPIAALHRLLTIRPLLIAGRLSYGMYVYHLIIFRTLDFLGEHFFALHTRSQHNPIFAAIGIPFAILVTTAVAELSFRFIEEPFLRLKRFFPSPAAPVS